jgi:hypothetical protein
MELHVTGEPEAKLTHSAAEQGRSPDELAQDVRASYSRKKHAWLKL